MKAFTHLLAASATVILTTQRAMGATYGQTDSISGSGFLSAFSHQAIADPTHGRVYVFPLSLPIAVVSSVWETETTSAKRRRSRRTSPSHRATTSSSARTTRRRSARAAPAGTRSGFRATSSSRSTSRCMGSLLTLRPHDIGTDAACCTGSTFDTCRRDARMFFRT